MYDPSTSKPIYAILSAERYPENTFLTYCANLAKDMDRPLRCIIHSSLTSAQKKIDDLLDALNDAKNIWSNTSFISSNQNTLAVLENTKTYADGALFIIDMDNSFSEVDELLQLKSKLNQINDSVPFLLVPTDVVYSAPSELLIFNQLEGHSKDHSALDILTDSMDIDFHFLLNVDEQSTTSKTIDDTVKNYFITNDDHSYTLTNSTHIIEATYDNVDSIDPSWICFYNFYNTPWKRSLMFFLMSSSSSDYKRPTLIV